MTGRVRLTVSVKLTQQLHIFFFVINLGIFISLDFQPSEFENAFIKYIKKSSVSKKRKNVDLTTARWIWVLKGAALKRIKFELLKILLSYFH